MVDLALDHFGVEVAVGKTIERDHENASVGQRALQLAAAGSGKLIRAAPTQPQAEAEPFRSELRAHAARERAYGAQHIRERLAGMDVGAVSEKPRLAVVRVY